MHILLLDVKLHVVNNWCPAGKPLMIQKGLAPVWVTWERLYHNNFSAAELGPTSLTLHKMSTVVRLEDACLIILGI